MLIDMKDFFPPWDPDRKWDDPASVPIADIRAAEEMIKQLGVPPTVYPKWALDYASELIGREAKTEADMWEAVKVEQARRWHYERPAWRRYVLRQARRLGKEARRARCEARRR